MNKQTIGKVALIAAIGAITGLTGCGKGGSPGETKTVTLPGGATMEMIYCPPGTYKMGSPATEKTRDDSFERPIKVTLTKGFWLGKYEVTQKQWKSVMGTNPSKDEFQGDDLPVGGLKWLDAYEFVKKVGNGARLPSEAEWEYACRAGTTTAFPWGDTCNGKEANCDGNWPYGTKEKGPKLGKPAKGGSYPPNAWGFCDMNGNMSEWCDDFIKIWPEDVTELVDPGCIGGRSKVLRGGSFYDAAKLCRAACRKGFEPDSGQPHLGFRMAMSE